MKGLVNYYIEEDPDNYQVVRGETDVYKFTLNKTQVELVDPVADGVDLKFDEKGVKVVKHETKVEFGAVLSPEQRQQYEAELDTLLRSELANVLEVVYFDHNLRSEWTDASRNSPAYHVHCDFTFDAAVARAKVLVGEDRAAEWFKDGSGHVGIVNVWRPTINSVEKSPLGIMDIGSYKNEDWHEVKLVYGERVGIMKGFRQNPQHKWYVIDKMRPDQAWLFCQFDTKSKISVPHSAITLDPTPDNARPRTSIETRCLIRYSD